MQYACEPPIPRERHLAELRRKRDTLEDAIALERGFAWRRTDARLNAVGIIVRP
jgi:hypothetical protein